MPANIAPLAPRWATRQEAAEYAGVDPATLRRWIAAGRLPSSHKLGRRIYVDLNEIDKLRVPIPTARSASASAS